MWLASTSKPNINNEVRAIKNPLTNAFIIVFIIIYLD